MDAVDSVEVVRHATEALGCHFDGALKSFPISGASPMGSFRENSIGFSRGFQPGMGYPVGSDFILVTDRYDERCSGLQLVCENPRLIFAELLEAFFVPVPLADIHSSAVIHPTASVAKTAVVGPFVHVGRDSVIGERTRLEPFVNIGDGVVVGNDCVLQAHSSIGSTGFGLEARVDGSLVRIPHLGGVRLGDGVWVGNFTAVAAGTIHPTSVGSGTHIDNLVHIAHNVEVGRNCQITACAEISGSVRIEDGVVIAPNVTVNQKLVIGEGAFIGSGSTVVRSIQAWKLAFGSPAREVRDRTADDR